MRSEISFNLSEGQRNEVPQVDQAERELMNMGLMHEQMSNARTMPDALDANNRRIESKDSMWKPAPIMGREVFSGGLG